MLDSGDAMLDRTDVVLAILGLVLVRHRNRTADDAIKCEYISCDSEKSQRVCMQHSLIQPWGSRNASLRR